MARYKKPARKGKKRLRTKEKRDQQLLRLKQEHMRIGRKSIDAEDDFLP
ncbi:MAG: hypothetical protein HXX80_03595 [Nitrososphaerales archaeon]|nr:hypothetical protein [Nitrososphaerales archaeon]